MLWYEEMAEGVDIWIGRWADGLVDRCIECLVELGVDGNRFLGVEYVLGVSYVCMAESSRRFPCPSIPLSLWDCRTPIGDASGGAWGLVHAPC